MPAPQNPWRNRTRRLFYFLGVSTTIYVVFNYALDRMRAARLRALKEKKEKDMMKQHFTSLTSTISYTLYALLPTLQPQLSDQYPVEQISQALQGLSVSSSANESVNPTPDNSVLLPPPTQENLHVEHENQAPSPEQPGIDQSWSSEFKAESVAESEQPSLVGDSLINVGDDDAASSTLSQSISLPPTDTSSFTPSPTSDMSQLHPSPPRVPEDRISIPSAYAGKSKKELWRDLKVQTITRSLTTAYLIPLLYLLTSSQLSTLARERYLNDIDDNLPPISTPRPHSNAPTPAPKKRGILAYFSTEGMGLDDFVDSRAPSYLNPARHLPSAISQYLPFSSGDAEEESQVAAKAARRDETEFTNAEDERVYLTYSWWILHEGWKGVAKRVEDSVEEVFGGMALKKELDMEDWHRLIREVRARVETEVGASGQVLYSFLPHILPTYPLPSTTSSESCPIPTTPPVNRARLTSLLDQTSVHLKSADATYLIEVGVTVMTRKLSEGLKEDLYSGSEIGLILGEPQPDVNLTRRLVDCLPAIDRWGKGVWEAVPDTGIENLTAIPEFEAFAALIFGDWAPR